MDELDNRLGHDNFYEDVHLHIQRSHIVGNSRVNPPKIGRDGLPEPGFNCNINQYGRLEGMHQKFWTLSTICLIKATAEDLDINIDSLGQGDNQVIIINWKKSQMDI